LSFAFAECDRSRADLPKAKAKPGTDLRPSDTHALYCRRHATPAE